MYLAIEDIPLYKQEKIIQNKKRRSNKTKTEISS